MVLSLEEIEKRVSDSYELPNEVLSKVPNPMVSIRTSTYNHGPYIRQCIEGVLMQKTTFSFEYIIGEDCSTDETREIVLEYSKKYPNIIRVVTADYNVGSKANGRRCIQRCRGKYMAICEGDDYWIDPYKLQKQVDFLEQNKDYGLVHSFAKCYYENKSSYGKKNLGENFSNIDELLIANRIVTLTVCFRKELYLGYIRDIIPKYSWKMGDYPLWLYIALHSKVHFIDNVMGVYRSLEESASHSRNLQKNINFCLSSYSISEFFALEYKKDYNLKNIKKQTLYSIIYAYVLLDKKVDFKVCPEVYALKLMDMKMTILYLLSYSKSGRKILMRRWN